MNINQSSKQIPMTRFCHRLLTLLLLAVCQYPATAAPLPGWQPGTLPSETGKITPTIRRAQSQVSTPVFRPGPCSFSTPMTVEIVAEAGTEIYYTTDGTEPTISEQCKYNGPVVISTTTTFKAIAVDAEGNQSPAATAVYTCTRHGIGEGYDPTSPGNPGEGGQTTPKGYSVTVVANPTCAGSAYPGSGKYQAGERVYVYTYANNGFTFKNWTIDGTEVSTESSFYYVMPEYDVTIVANYEYNPASPGNPSPEEQKVKHPVVVRAIPSIAASVSPSGAFSIEENATQRVYTYAQSGWRLTGWTINGEKQQSSDSWLDVTMGEKALDIAAYFTFNPSSPANPSANYYNPATGELIVDDFAPGNLRSTISNLVGNDNYANVSSVVVKGEMTAYDLGTVILFSNASTLDISRTGGITEIPYNAFSSVGASSISLPETVTSVGNYAFSECSNLASLTVYAMVPPTCYYNTFSSFTNKDNCTVYVPADAIELYKSADYWKDFTILPIINDAHVLQVNLPTDASNGKYKNNTIDIVNINSGVRQKYVVSDRTLYTFNALRKDEKYNVYMFSQGGLEIGRIENVVIPDKDIEVTFENLKTLHTVFAKVIADGNDVTAQTTVEWIKPLADGTTTYLRKGLTLGEVPEGQALICRVTLDDRLGTAYIAPEDAEFTVGAGNNTCTVDLTPFRSIELTGSVNDGDGTALQDASVSINQTLNGKHSKTYTTKTDRKGEWKLQVLDAPETRVTYAAAECVNVNDTIGAFEPSVKSLDLGKVTMKSIVGARITYGFTYKDAGAEKTESYYSDYQNVSVGVYNVTQKREHKDVSLQYPVLAVLDEDIKTGDELRLTATSKTGAFKAIERTVNVGENQRAEVTFDIIGKGGITASYEMTENPSVTAMLYGSNGELIKKTAYTEAKATFAGLDDGEYTLVTMGHSDLMNSILRLSNFGEIGLTEGKDYVKNTVAVKSGKLSEIKNRQVPIFDESLFYYTTSASYFSSNKQKITTGEYLTLRSKIDFKKVYANDISDVELVIDLPEGCEFVENSVMQGPNLISSTVNDRRITVSIADNFNSQIRLCVIPTNAQTNLNITGNVCFSHNGKNIMQPLGSVHADVKSLEIEVPAKIAKPQFFAKGYAEVDSKVYVKDSKGNIIGSGRAGHNGYWNINCELINPINLHVYDIYATIQSVNDIEYNTETRQIKYNTSIITPTKVIGVSDDVTEGEIKFDFVDKPTGPYYYTIIASDGGSITFLVYLTDNNPDKIANMVLYNHRVDGNVDRLYPKYDVKKKRWYATMELNMDNVPVNVSLDYDVIADTDVDLSDVHKQVQNTREDAIQIDSSFAKINQYFESTEEVSIETLNRLYSELGLGTLDTSTQNAPSDIATWTDEQIETYVDQLLSELEASDLAEESKRLQSSLAYNGEECTIPFEDGTKMTLGTCNELDKATLISEGYEKIPTADGSELYYKYDELSVEIVDFGNNSYLRIECVAPEEAQSAMARAPRVNSLLAKAYAIVSRLYDAKSTIDSLAGNDSTPVETVLTRVADVLTTIVNELHDFDKVYNDMIADLTAKVDKLLANSTAKVLEARLGIEELKIPTIKNTLLERWKPWARNVSLLKNGFKGLKVATKAMGKAMGKVVPILDWIILANDARRNLLDIKSIVQSIPAKGCDDDDMKIIKECHEQGRTVSHHAINNCVGNAIINIVSDAEIIVGTLAAIPTGGAGLLATAVGIGTKLGCLGVSFFIDDMLSKEIAQFKARVNGLHFECKEPEEPEKPENPRQPNTPKDKVIGTYISNTPDAQVHIDPSGFVYEAVPENRVEGVQASIYYKETKEDMYGDPYEDIVLWNAEEYAQKNPLFTDENGMYRWDVPQGLWQVKFEKDGYQTAYSEWLPVPPPQLEVNIGIVQNKQPEVTEARAYEQGVEVQFDKYMDPATLTTDNIYVTANGEKLAGTVTMVDTALADEYADEEDADALRYASRVRFVPETPLSVTTGEVKVFVSRNVLSYAGIPMPQNYSQTLDVEREVQDIMADNVKVLYGGEKQVTVYALPYDAAVGRTLHISNSSDLIATVDATEVVFDEEGTAVVTVKGELPGSARLQFSIDDVTVKGECEVNVVTELIEAEVPVASRASGTAVYRGSKVRLTTGSKEGVIYFTTDGSCPCDADGTRRKYTVPIVIDGDMHIKAMTAVGTGSTQEVSETVEFNYTLKKTSVDLKMADGWTWMSHNLETALPAATVAAEAGVNRILTQDKESVRDPQYGMLGTLTEIPASQSFKVQTSAASTTKNLSDFAWNPATPISLAAGWNWLGYPVEQTMSVDEAFAPTEVEKDDVIVGQSGFATYDGEKWVGTLEVLTPGTGYMYQSCTVKDVVYNTSIVSSAAAKYTPGIADRLPLALDIQKYASVMPVMATIKGSDGTQFDNEDYQVLAFSGSECRGIGRVVDGVVMMNVYGDTGDTVTLQVVDNNSEISYSDSTTLDVGEKVVGTLENPFEIVLSDLTGAGRVEYDGNVKVYTEGDMLRIKGIAPEDIRLVEMYDIAGHKVLRETTVSESGVRLPEMLPGAYVVIVDGNGRFTYHKISVK